MEAYTLTQDKSISVALGDNVKLECKTSSTTDYSVSWYKQKSGGGPQFVLRDSYKSTGLPSRFGYSFSNSNEYLHINGVTAEDEAVYYCGCVGGCGPTSNHNVPLSFSANTKSLASLKEVFQ